MTGQLVDKSDCEALFVGSATSTAVPSLQENITQPSVIGSSAANPGLIGKQSFTNDAWQ